MNCEKCEELIGELLDGTLSGEDKSTLNMHLEQCLDCSDVRNDLQSIVSFCQTQRGQYSAPPNERALWLRIRNIVEAESQSLAEAAGRTRPQSKHFWSDWMARSWELSISQLGASVAAIVLIASLATAVGLRRWENSSRSQEASVAPVPQVTFASSRDRMWQQQQAISYWNQRVETNKARWNQEMRDTFDRNLKVIDQAVSDSLNELNQNPHDEVSEEMLNAALNEKLALLREFSDL
jgi:hypothetical protein